jgi:hypothetical protein
VLDQLEAISVQLGHVMAALSRAETRLGEAVGRLTRLEDLVGVLVARTEVTVVAAERAADEALAAHEGLRQFRSSLPCQPPCAAQLTLVAEAD